MRHATRTLPGWLPLALLSLASPCLAQEGLQGFRIDPVHTRVLVALDHAGYSTALGTVSGSTGMVAFDPSDWSRARVDVSVPLQRLDFGDDGWNRAARRMLGATSWPDARFISDRVEGIDANHAKACGTLYLHGKQQPLCLDVRFNQSQREPLPPFHDKAGFSATATLERSAFGIDDWKTLVGDRVELRIEAEAIRDDAVLPGLQARSQ